MELRTSTGTAIGYEEDGKNFTADCQLQIFLDSKELHFAAGKKLWTKVGPKIGPFRNKQNWISDEQDLLFSVHVYSGKKIIHSSRTFS